MSGQTWRGREKDGFGSDFVVSQSVRMIMARRRSAMHNPFAKKDPSAHPSIRGPDSIGEITGASSRFSHGRVAELSFKKPARRSLSRLVAPLSLLPAFLTLGIAVVGCNCAICIRSVVAETNSTLVALKEDAEYTRVKFGHFRPRKTRRKEAPIFDVRAEGKGVKK